MRNSRSAADYAQANYAAAIAEGHKAEKLKPHDQLVPHKFVAGVYENWRQNDR